MCLEKEVFKSGGRQQGSGMVRDGGQKECGGVVAVLVIVQTGV